ncbi:MAG: hypothetical protein IK114_14305 [Fibrobacter sp.]|nr:hypothetical protein [Fibrobacter sp.]
MSYQGDNDRKIKAGFKRLAQSKDSIIEKGMIELMEKAILIALATHDQDHWFHRSTADSYGWLVLHNGAHIAHKVNEGQHGEGHAYGDLMKAAREAPNEGWVGILLASMYVGVGGSRPRSFIFNLDYEISVLNSTREDLEREFNKYFKEVQTA